MPDHTWIMSPQAHRRMLRTMTEKELRDLAEEIERDLRSAGLVGTDLLAPTILTTLTSDY